MDLFYLLKVVVLGIVEGLTEFLPVSSTGHLILVGEWIQFDSEGSKIFDVVIQLGAILAVCWLYRDKILSMIAGVFRRDPVALNFAMAVILAFVPSAIVGALFHKTIKAVLFNPTVVAAALVVGGLIILWIEEHPPRVTTDAPERMTWKQALGIGLAQVVSMIPGTSRSGATIIGAMLAGLSRSAATEFSFFLAIPTMIGASTLELIKGGATLSSQDTIGIAVGFVVAFVSALVVIKFLIRYVAHHTLSVFAWYRIAFGLALFAWFAFHG